MNVETKTETKINCETKLRLKGLLHVLLILRGQPGTKSTKLCFIAWKTNLLAYILFHLCVMCVHVYLHVYILCIITLPVTQTMQTACVA